MVGCDLSYGVETGNGKTAAGNTSIVENFLPAYRTFKIHPLRSNTSYWLYMTCKDRAGGWHVSDTINFTTSVATLYQVSTRLPNVQKSLPLQPIVLNFNLKNNLKSCNFENASLPIHICHAYGLVFVVFLDRILGTDIYFHPHNSRTSPRPSRATRCR